MVEFTLDARTEFSFQFNKVEGLTGGNLKLQIEAIIAVKIGLKSRKLIPVTVTNADGSKSRVRVEEFKAEGRRSVADVNLPDRPRLEGEVFGTQVGVQRREGHYRDL